MAFKRNQVVWALWHTNVYPVRPSADMSNIPKTFSYRVENFYSRGLGIPTNRRSGHHGVDEDYGFFEAFELAIALELQNVGISQGEICTYLISFRHDLADLVKRLPLTAPAPRRFLIVRPRVIQEILRRGSASAPSSADRPMAVDDEGLKAVLHKLGGADRTQVIIELGDLATMLNWHLENSPIIKRGGKR